jgi:hypothetical protein
MSERERESEVIEIDNDITVPGASKQTNRTVMDKLIKKPSHEDFVVEWSETVFGKGLKFEFFKILPPTDYRLQQEVMRVLAPLYKDIGVLRAFDTSGQNTNMSFIANSMVAEMHTLGKENVFSFTMDGSFKGDFPIIQEHLPWV